MSCFRGFCGERSKRDSIVAKVRGPWQKLKISTEAIYVKKKSKVFGIWCPGTEMRNPHFWGILVNPWKHCLDYLETSRPKSLYLISAPRRRFVFLGNSSQTLGSSEESLGEVNKRKTFYICKSKSKILTKLITIVLDPNAFINGYPFHL